MAYYSGQATSYQELLDVLVAACVTEGWTWADGILSKSNIFLKLNVNSSGVFENGEGVIAKIGTGKLGAALENSIGGAARLGRIASAGWGSDFNFPVKYNIHVFEEIVEEVFFIIQVGIDQFQYLAFGQSDISGHGAWMSSTCGLVYNSYTHNLVTNNPSFTGGSWTYSHVRAPFWQKQEYGFVNYIAVSEVIRDEVNGKWLNNNSGDLYAFSQIEPLINRQPSNWDSNTIFLPINVYATKYQSKVALVLSIKNAHYLRIDNLEPEQIITLGNDKWKVYPFFRKNRQQRDSGWDYNHSGTFGWVIRYDGP